MKLPAPIQAYFDADKEAGAPAPISAFATNASVTDEGKTHVGRDAIAGWWREAKAQYQHQSEPREISRAGDLVTVRAEVSGQFPGSPALLTFTFNLEDEQIASLEIGA